MMTTSAPPVPEACFGTLRTVAAGRVISLRSVAPDVTVGHTKMPTSHPATPGATVPTAKPCPLAVYLAEGLAANLTPAQAIHEALSQLNDWDWVGGGTIDFTGLDECRTCHMWLSDTILVDGQAYCDAEKCLPKQETANADR